MAFAKGTHNPVVKTRTASLMANVIASLENIVAKAKLSGEPVFSKEVI